MADHDTNPSGEWGSPQLLLSECIPSQTEQIEPLVERFLHDLGDLFIVDGHRDAR